MTVSQHRAGKALLAFVLLTGLVAFGSKAFPTGQMDVVGSYRYVSPSGDDANPGTLERPWRTLGKGLSALGPGDKLWVRGGTYVEDVGGGTFLQLRPGTASARIGVAAYPGERPVVQGLFWVSDPDHWTFSGINVTWRDGLPSNKHMVRIRNGVGWSWQDSEVWAARSFANINVLSSVAGEPAQWRITNNCIHDAVGDPSHGDAKDQLLYINTGTSAGKGMIDHNLLFNAPRGKAVKITGPDAGTGSANVDVAYNTIVQSHKPSVVVGWASANTRVYRNLIVGSDDVSLIRGYQLEGAGNVAFENLGFAGKRFLSSDSGYQSSVADGGGNVFPYDPRFVGGSGCGGFRPSARYADAYGYTAGR